MAQTSDVVIIGAGIMGCSAAFHLAQRGVSVVVLEKDSVGAGGTGRSSAIIRQHYSNELTARMALHSLHVFESFDERVGGDCGFERTGWVALVSERDRLGLEANLTLQSSFGIRTELITADDVAAMVPELDTRDVAAAAFEPESGYADPHLSVTGYADAARRHGARIHLNCRVTAIEMSGNRVAAVRTERERHPTPVVVNCAGPWGGQVARLAGAELPIVSSRVQVAVFRRPHAFGRHPVVMDFVTGTYLRPETGNLTLVGSIDPREAEDVVDPDDYPEHADTTFVSDMGERFVQRYPPMDLSESRGGYASLYAVTPDWHPIVGEIPADSGLFVCAGFSGHGFKLAPAVGVMVADLVTRVTDPEFPADLFRASRFAEGQRVRGQYEYGIAG